MWTQDTLLPGNPLHSIGNGRENYGGRPQPKGEGSVNIQVPVPQHAHQPFVVWVDGDVAICTLHIHLGQEGPAATIGYHFVNRIVHVHTGQETEEFLDPVIDTPPLGGGHVQDEAPFPFGITPNRLVWVYGKSSGFTGPSTLPSPHSIAR